MRIAVDRSSCNQYGQCEAMAPYLFSLDQDEVLTYVAHPSDDHLTTATGAADAFLCRQFHSLTCERGNRRG